MCVYTYVFSVCFVFVSFFGGTKGQNKTQDEDKELPHFILT